MKEVIINFKNSKRLRNLMMGLGIELGSLAFLYYLLVMAPKIKVVPIAFFIVLCGMGLFMLIGGIRDMASRDKAGLIVDQEGINFKGTPVGRKAGKIEWKDIKSMSVDTAYGSRFLFLQLRNPDKYLSKVTPAQAYNIAATKGVGVTDNELDISFEELEKLLSKYYKNYYATNGSTGTI